MKHLPVVLALAALAFAPTLAKADPITYTFNQTYTQDASDYFTVTGTLTTDGVIGQITSSDITGYDLFVTETTYTTRSTELSSAGGTATYYAGGLNATAHDLMYNFNEPGYLIFEGTGLLGFQPGDVEVSGLGIGLVAPPETGTQVIASVATAPTPEPSSLVLLSTGALSIAGAVRRRCARP